MQPVLSMLQVFPGGSDVNHLPIMWETRVRSLDQEDPLEKEMATRSSILGENSTDRGAWQATVHGLEEIRTIEHLRMLTTPQQREEIP